MTNRWKGCLLGACVAASVAAGCRGEAGDGKEGALAVAHPHVELRREDDGSVVMTFDEESRSRLALKLAEVKASSLAPEREAYGRVLDPSTFVAAVGEVRAAASALQAATSELERSKRLAAHDNVPVRAVEAAVVAESQARAAFESAQARLLLGWGAELASRKDVADLVAALVSRDAVLVRIDLPSREPMALRGVHFAFADSPGDSIEGSLVGAAPAVDEKLQGQGFLALVRPNRSGLAPGAFLTAVLELEGASTPAALVARSSVVRAEGKAWIYLQQGETGSYRRVEVSLDRATAAGWLVTRGAEAGDRAVVEGAQQLLSEEALADSAAGD